MGRRHCRPETRSPAAHLRGPCGRSSNAPSTSLFRSIKKSLPFGEASMHVVFVVALSGVLPSPTQMAPNNRELNKYEANKGEGRIRRHEICAFLHGFSPCLPMVRGPARAVNLCGDLDVACVTPPARPGVTYTCPRPLHPTLHASSSRPSGPRSGPGVEGSWHRATCASSRCRDPSTRTPRYARAAARDDDLSCGARRGVMRMRS